jgi:hypothetical protein
MGGERLSRIANRQLEKHLKGYAPSEDGIRQRSEMLDRLSEKVLDFVRTEFPEVEESKRGIIVRVVRISLRSKIEEIENSVPFRAGKTAKAANP